MQSLEVEGMNTDKQNYWFPAKRYGWGWGSPIRWQGWLMLALYVLLALVGIRWLEPQQHPIAYLLYLLALTVVMTLVCWLKGERPRWRRGK